jgi:ubiquitin C-terminal hydrolase
MYQFFIYRTYRLITDGIALIFLDTITEIVKPTTSYPLFGADPSSTTITKRATLLRCLDKYIEEEALEESETYYCSKCKNNLAPMKKMDLWTSPDVLAIHLKRFYYCQGTYGVFRQKISDFVDFPLNGLDLTPYIRGPISDSAPPIYDLCSVSYHSGTLGGGHYTAGCRNLENGLWYYFNDDSVSPLEPANVVSDLAYVLIYKRRKGSLIWGGVTPTEASEALQDDPPNS